MFMCDSSEIVNVNGLSISGLGMTENRLFSHLDVVARSWTSRVGSSIHSPTLIGGRALQDH